MWGVGLKRTKSEAAADNEWQEMGSQGQGDRNQMALSCDQSVV